MPNKTEILQVEKVPFDIGLAVDSGFYVSGTSQSGKSNLAKILVEKLINRGIACYVLDSSKAWTHDTPISNVLLVNTREKRYAWQSNTTFDISALSARQKVLFVNQFCHDLYAQHVDGYAAKEFIIFEEAQTYLPQGCTRLAIRRSSPCENVLDVVTVGANYGLGFGLITQFPALVDKPPVKITQQRYFGWT
jgi:DNA helicase HerA-like ATPase